MINQKDILKKIWQSEQGLKENSIEMRQAKELWDELLIILDNMPSNSIYFLRYNKLKKSNMWTWYSRKGFPVGNPWKDMFEPFLTIFEQYLAEKTLKSRFTTDDLFIETRAQGQNGDQHILLGNRDGSGDKAHIIIDGTTAEIRIEDKKHKAPEEFIKKIETTLTLPDGNKIRTTREVIEML